MKEKNKQLMKANRVEPMNYGRGIDEVSARQKRRKVYDYANKFQST